MAGCDRPDDRAEASSVGLAAQCSQEEPGLGCWENLWDPRRHQPLRVIRLPGPGFPYLQEGGSLPAPGLFRGLDESVCEAPSTAPAQVGRQVSAPPPQESSSENTWPGLHLAQPGTGILAAWLCTQDI